MSRMSKRRQAGFTLVELTISLVLVTMISIVVIMFMINTLRTYATASAKAELLAQAQTAADRIGSDIMLSAGADNNNRVDDPNSPVAGNFNGWASDSDTLVLATAVEDQSKNIVYADPANYVSHKNNIIYYLNGDKLFRRTLAANVTGNSAKTTCPPASTTASCRADPLVLSDVTTFSVSYRNGLNQTVAPDEARSVELSITLQRKNDTKTKVMYTTRTVFRND